MRPPRKIRHVLISSGVGLFSGGTQRTALEIMQSTSSKSVVRRGPIGSAGKAEVEQGPVEQSPA